MEEQDSDRPTEAMAAMFLDEQGTHQDGDEATTAMQPVVAPGDEGGDTTATVTLAGDHLAPGTMVGGYVIEAELASGGVSNVFAAAHPVIGKRVAIKVLRGDLCGDPIAVDRFVTEARAANAIRHPNIIDIFDLGALPDGRQYLVMDLLEGESLRKLLARGPLAVADASTILADIASALGAAHAKGIVHRDLKPDNVFLARPTSRYEVKLLDFGVAKLLAATPLGLRTRTGALIGTVGYMSPEQGRGKSVDHRTDIYALGATAFEMLSGRLPFNHANPMDILIAHETAPVPSLRQVAPDVPPQLAQVVEAMLSKRPDDRPTLEQIRLVAKRLRAHTPTAVAAQPGTTPSRGTSPAPPSRGSHQVIRPPATVEDTGFDQDETTHSLAQLAHSPTEHAAQAYRTGAVEIPTTERPTIGDRPEYMGAAEEPEPETQTNELPKLHGVETTFPRAGAQPPMPAPYLPGRPPSQTSYPYPGPPSAAHAMHAMPAYQSMPSPDAMPQVHGGHAMYQQPQPPAPVEGTEDEGGTRWIVIALIAVLVSALGVVLALTV